jgi:hypothetical protein
MKMPALVGKKDFDNVFKNSDTSFSSGPFLVILKKKRNILNQGWNYHSKKVC